MFGYLISFLTIFALLFYQSRKKAFGRKHKMLLLGLFSLLGIIVLSAVRLAKSDLLVKNNGIEVTVRENAVETTQDSSNQDEMIELPESISMDVPLLNQMNEPILYNGCEVTSLAMLLLYLGMDVTKNQLADELVSVPLTNDDGTRGDPRVGFVGDITGQSGPGYSVYSEPIMELAEAFITEEYQVVDLNGVDFDVILETLGQGNPVWTLTTVTFTATNDIEVWQTANGPVEISWSVHSVLITGYDEDDLFINDPYGEKRVVDQEAFIESWVQMGSQAFTIEKSESAVIASSLFPFLF